MLHYTKEELEKLLSDRMNELLLFSGGYLHLAKMLGVAASTAQGWAIRGRISKAGARLIERNPRLKDQFKAKYLRPDL